MNRLKHILSSRQFDLGFLINLYKDASLIADLMQTREGKELLTHVLPGYVLGEMFWQESSRTYHSFAAATKRLGAEAVSERGVKKTRVINGKIVTKWELVFSSETKDAHFEDEVRAWASYYDALILRTAEEGLVARAAAIVDEFGYDVPIINAGDGLGEHPTQTLLDLLTFFQGLKLDIEKDWNKLSKHSVAFINDGKHSRTIHSFALTLGKIFNVPITNICPPGLEMPRDLVAEITAAGCDFKETNELREADVYYVTRLQREYFKTAKEFKEYKNYFSITRETADKYGVKVVMHPFPRSKEGNELPIWLPSDPTTHSISLDKDPRAFYFYQMKIGVPVRMALLKYLLNPHLELKKLQEEKLVHEIKAQCLGCRRIEYREVGWTERAPKCGYIETVGHTFCPSCQPEPATT